MRNELQEKQQQRPFVELLRVMVSIHDFSALKSVYLLENDYTLKTIREGQKV